MHNIIFALMFVGLVAIILGTVVGLLQGTVIGLIYGQPYRQQIKSCVIRNILAGLLTAFVLVLLFFNLSFTNYFQPGHEGYNKLLYMRFGRVCGLVLGGFCGFWLAAFEQRNLIHEQLSAASNEAPESSSRGHIARRFPFLISGMIGGAFTGVLFGVNLEPTIGS